MSNKIYRIAVRIDEDTETILNELVEIEKAEAEKFGRFPMNKSWIIITAIKMYYAARVNNNAKNSYLDLVDSRMTQQLETYMIPQKKQIMDMYKDLKELILQICLIMKVMMTESFDLYDAGTIKSILNSNYDFEMPIKRKAEEIMKGGKGNNEY